MIETVQISKTKVIREQIAKLVEQFAALEFAPKEFIAAAAFEPSPGVPTNTAVTSPDRLAIVNNSPAVFVITPSM